MLSIKVFKNNIKTHKHGEPTPKEDQNSDIIFYSRIQILPDIIQISFTKGVDLKQNSHIQGGYQFWGVYLETKMGLDFQQLIEVALCASSSCVE